MRVVHPACHHESPFQSVHRATPQGWRVVFLGVACIAAVAAVSVVLGGIEPRNLKPKAEETREHRTLLRAILAGLKLILHNTWQVFRIPSFLIILAAGESSMLSCLHRYASHMAGFHVYSYRAALLATGIVGTIAFSGLGGYRVGALPVRSAMQTESFPGSLTC